MKTSAESHCFTAVIYFHLGLIYKRTDRYKEALCALDKSLKILYLYPIINKDFFTNLNNEMEELCEIIESDD